MFVGQYKGQPVAWYLDCGKITFECFARTFSEKFYISAIGKLLIQFFFKFTAFVSDAYRYLYVNFQSDWISLRVIKNSALSLINDGVIGSYVLIGTQCSRKFEKVPD